MTDESLHSKVERYVRDHPGATMRDLRTAFGCTGLSTALILYDDGILRSCFDSRTGGCRFAHVLTHFEEIPDGPEYKTRYVRGGEQPRRYVARFEFYGRPVPMAVPDNHDRSKGRGDF